jgi:tetratricopeptide (TPR) repeat protein
MDRIEKLKNFLSQSPNDSFLTHALGLEYFKLGNTAEALFYFESNRKNQPQYVGTYYHLGKLLESLNNTEEAAKVYDEGLEIAKAQNDMHAFNELRAAADDLL